MKLVTITVGAIVTDMYFVGNDLLEQFLEEHKFNVLCDEDPIPGVDSSWSNYEMELAIVVNYPVTAVKWTAKKE